MNKRFLRFVLSSIMVCAWTLPFVTPVSAEEEITVEIAGKKVSFDHSPVIERGITLVQFRPVFEAMGLEVKWDPETNRVTGERRGTRIELTPGETQALVNGETKTLEQAPRFIDGLTFIPLRFIGEASEYDVIWKEDTRTAQLKSTTATIVLDLLNVKSIRFVGEDGSSADQSEWNGKGKLVAPTGDTLYEGEFHNGALQGQGVFMLKGMPYYIGQWKNNRFDGTGKLYAAGKVQYEGEFVKGKMQGTGKLFTQDGKVLYEGDFTNDKVEGSGTMYYSAGPVAYQGQVKDFKMNGKGKLFYKEGGVYYEGDFKDGQREGLGKLYAAGGKLMYDGAFADDKPVKSLASFVTDRIKTLHAWKTLETNHLAIYYYSGDSFVQSAGTKLDAIVDSLRKKLGDHEPRKEAGTARIPVYVMTEADFRKELDIGYSSIVGEWYDTTMFLSLASDTNEIYLYFQHEMTHAITVGSDDSKAKEVPVWFKEGTATYHESDPPYNKFGSERENAIRYVVRNNKLIPWSSTVGMNDKSTDEQLSISYAEAWSIWEYLSRTYGEDKLLQIYYQSGKFPELLEKATGKKLDVLESDWIKYVKDKYK